MPIPPPKQRLGSLGLLAIVLLLAWSGSGCQSHATAPPAPSPAGPARRIVSLAPNLTEILFALGAGPRVVGCTNRCNHPPEVASLARIGDVKLDFERIVSLGADLLVAESVTNAQDEARLRSLGQNVLRVDSSTIEGYYATLHALGEVTGDPGRSGAPGSLPAAGREGTARPDPGPVLPSSAPASWWRSSLGPSSRWGPAPSSTRW